MDFYISLIIADDESKQMLHFHSLRVDTLIPVEATYLFLIVVVNGIISSQNIFISTREAQMENFFPIRDLALSFRHPPPNFNVTQSQ